MVGFPQRSRVRRQQAVERNGLQFAHLVVAESEFGEEQTAVKDRVLPRFEPQDGPAFHEGAVEESLCRRHRHQDGDFAATARLAEDRDQVGIASKLRHVIAHPFERLDDIEHADAAGEREIRASLLADISKAEHVQTVVQADDYDFAAMSKIGALGNGARGRNRWRGRRHGATPSRAASRRDSAMG